MKQILLPVDEDTDLDVTLRDYISSFLDSKSRLSQGSPATVKQVWKLKKLGYSGKAELLTVKEASDKITELSGGL